jgi:gluconokinase
MADALNRELLLPVWGETSALGAAFWALLSARGEEGLEKAGDFVKLRDSCSPNLESVEIYNRMYPLFEKLYQSLEKSFDEVAELQAELGRQNGEMQGHIDRHSRGGGSPEKPGNTGFPPSRE